MQHNMQQARTAFRSKALYLGIVLVSSVLLGSSSLLRRSAEEPQGLLAPAAGASSVHVNILNRLPLFVDKNEDGAISGKEFFMSIPLGLKVQAGGAPQSLSYYGKKRDLLPISALIDDDGEQLELDQQGSAYALAAYLPQSAAGQNSRILLEDAALFSAPKLTAIDTKGRKVPVGTFVVITDNAPEGSAKFWQVAYSLDGYAYNESYLAKSTKMSDDSLDLEYIRLIQERQHSKSELVQEALIWTPAPPYSSALKVLEDGLDEVPSAVDITQGTAEQDIVMLNFAAGTIPLYDRPNPYIYAGYLMAKGDTVYANLKIGDKVESLGQTVAIGDVTNAADGKAYIAVYLSVSQSTGNPEDRFFIPKQRTFLK